MRRLAQLKWSTNKQPFFFLVIKEQIPHVSYHLWSRFQVKLLRSSRLAFPPHGCCSATFGSSIHSSAIRPSPRSNMLSTFGQSPYWALCCFLYFPPLSEEVETYFTPYFHRKRLRSHQISCSSQLAGLGGPLNCLLKAKPPLRVWLGCHWPKAMAHVNK